MALAAGDSGKSALIVIAIYFGEYIGDWTIIINLTAFGNIHK